ncbi:hypothetical protein PAXINDRAFT_8118 [Paxillus involutus ATCC 200175]|nr:hypothetical protein PAXINDRAFT_8118 [Paxillus involutus ATCC 200175]
MGSFQDEASWQRAIIENCVADNKTHGLGSGIFTCDLGSTTYKIKYGVSKALATRIATQLALYNAAQEANSIRIPRLVHHFDDEGRTYLVMEHIDFVQVSTSDMDNRIGYALRWLSCLRGDKLGPVEGGCILHGFFKDGEAPLAFKSVEALELYIAKTASFETGTEALVESGSVVKVHVYAIAEQESAELTRRTLDSWRSRCQSRDHSPSYDFQH